MKNSALFSFLLLASSLATAGEPRTISVNGSAQVKVKADEARVYCQFEDRCAVDGSVAETVEKSKKRTQPGLEYLKGVVGADGKVTVVTRIQRVEQYNSQTNKSEFAGHKVVTSILVLLQGQEAIDQKLAKLYDTNLVKADEVSPPSLGLSDQRYRKAELEASKKAVADAVARAKAQLEKGEKLGAALTRNSGDGSYPSYKNRPALMSARGDERSESDSRALVEVDQEMTVTANVRCVFGVACKPDRVSRKSGK